MLKLRLAVLATAIGPFLGLPGASAHDGMVHHGCPAGQVFAAGDLSVSGAFARATLPSARAGAGYLTITNAGAGPDRLVRVTSEVSSRIELHDMSIEDGIMTMAPIDGGLVIAAGATVSLAPGGAHIMFVGPNQPFREGECLDAVLSFGRAGDVAVQFNVGPVGAKAAPEDHSGH